ncbi:MAG: hypothetical protein ACYTKD_29270 [Planctomycetota bacterium]|jgi:hypothetical protein
MRKGNGKRYRWIVSLEGLFRVPIQRLVCKSCGKTVSLLPRILFPFHQCTRRIAARIRDLWERGLNAMADVRHRLAAACPALSRLALSSMYRWARLPCLRACGPHAQAGGTLTGHTT